MDFDVKKLVKNIYDAIDEKSGEDICILDIKAVSSLTDYFVIASASSERQTKAIADNIEQIVKENMKINVNGKEGQNRSRWILLDYGDVIVHVFHNEERELYNLEGLWKDAPYVDVDKLK